jgi:hypothetical protein
MSKASKGENEDDRSYSSCRDRLNPPDLDQIHSDLMKISSQRKVRIVEVPAGLQPY